MRRAASTQARHVPSATPLMTVMSAGSWAGSVSITGSASEDAQCAPEGQHRQHGTGGAASGSSTGTVGMLLIDVGRYGGHDGCGEQGRQCLAARDQGRRGHGPARC